MRRPEEALHRALVAQFRLRMQPPWLFWATPNQKGTRKAYEQAILAALGVKAGIPDLFVLGPGPVLIGVECKAPPAIGKRGVSKAKPRLSDAQAEVFPQLAALGVPVIVARDVDDALAALSTMGVMFRGRAL